MRIDDLDTPRVVPGAADTIMQQLEHLALLWDGEVTFQSRNIRHYADALRQLHEQGRLYRCSCSRRIISASAPHMGEEGPIYPGTCRHRGLSERNSAWRINTSGVVISFSDIVYGKQQQHLEHEVGDFPLRRNDGVFNYQLAVVIDDYLAGVNQVIRGRDLLFSTPRQIFLHHCLGYTVPQYGHLPLALATNGEKISKRHHQVNVTAMTRRSDLLVDVLEFLGQNPPSFLRDEPPDVIMAWAVNAFDFSLIPQRDRQITATPSS